jgi:hypothetical protein
MLERMLSELASAEGFKRKEFFLEFLELIPRLSIDELRLTEPILLALTEPLGYRTPNQARCDGRIDMLHGAVGQRIKQLKDAEIEIEPSSVEHRVLNAVSLNTAQELSASFPDDDVWTILAKLNTAGYVSSLEVFSLSADGHNMLKSLRHQLVRQMAADPPASAE